MFIRVLFNQYIYLIRVVKVILEIIRQLSIFFPTRFLIHEKRIII